MTLNPTLATVLAIKDNISNIVQNVALPVSTRADLIAPQLAMVNQWVDQIPLVLDNPDAPASVNLVFAIRKDLFVAPQFFQCVLSTPGTELHPAFSAFLSLISKLIGAQKTDREKPPPKVRFDLYFISIQVVHVFHSLNAFRVSSPSRTSILTTI
jgi:hypothetical protein